MGCCRGRGDLCGNAPGVPRPGLWDLANHLRAVVGGRGIGLSCRGLGKTLAVRVAGSYAAVGPGIAGLSDGSIFSYARARGLVAVIETARTARTGLNRRLGPARSAGYSLAAERLRIL